LRDGTRTEVRGAQVERGNEKADAQRQRRTRRQTAGFYRVADAKYGK
jgi:hypothetical protein